MADRKAGTDLRGGDMLEVTIEKGVYRGLGLARHTGQVVLVPRGFPGDRLRVEVVSGRRDYLLARIQDLLSAGPGRRVAPCAHAAVCGGCSYQELEYPRQLLLKRSVVVESLRRAGLECPDEVPIVASPERGWRMRASLHVHRVGEQVRIGLHQEGSREVVDVEECWQLSPAMNGVLGGLRRSLSGLRPMPGVHGVLLAESADGARLVVALETAMNPSEPVEVALAEVSPRLTGLGVVAGRGRGSRFVRLAGEPTVETTVMGFSLRSHVLSFFQANRFLVEELAREVVASVPAGGKVLDLYSGVGLFTVPLAAKASLVLSAEISGTAVEDARRNAAAASIVNLRSFHGDVARALRLWPRESAETVVVDPPRTGLDRSVVEAIAVRRPESITYVSCDPPTLGRDLRAFALHGYRLAGIRAFDLFPDTFHVETVARLSR